MARSQCSPAVSNDDAAHSGPTNFSVWIRRFVARFVRYADDLTLYARSDTDLASMVESLVEELAAVGLL